MTILPHALKRARQTAGLSQPQLAKLARVSTGYIGMLETGTRLHPSAAIVERLAAALDIEISQLGV